MEFLVYILQSDKSGRFYTGMTNDIQRRVRQHDQNLNKSTANKGPWTLVWKSKNLTKTEAADLERKVKKRGAGRFLLDQQK